MNSDSILLTVSGGLQYQKLFVSYINEGMRCRILLSESKLQVIDNIIAFEKDMYINFSIIFSTFDYREIR